MFLYNTEHIGLSPYSGACAGGGGTAKWSYPAGNYSNYSSPAIDANGVSYFADWDLYAMNPTGSLKWDYSFPGYSGDTHSSPAIGADGTIYLGSQDGNLYAITPAGTEKWAYLTTTGDAVESSPAIGTDGTIYVGSDDGNLYAINSDGSLKWAYPTGGAVQSSPAIGPDGTIYVASNDGNLYALTDGGQGTVTQKWSPFSAGAEFYSSPTVGNAGGTIYFSSYGNNVVYAINASTGSENWEFAFPDDFASFSSPAIGPNGTIYVGSYGGNLYALTDGGSATEKWAFAAGGVVNSSPAIGADGTIYAGSNDGYIYAITDNGPYCPSCSPPVAGTPPSEKWPPLAIGTAVNSSPAIGKNASIYLGAGPNLYAQPPGPSAWPATSITAPSLLAFGNFPVGDTVTKTITLKNTGQQAMYLLGVTSSDPAEFAEISSTCPSSGTGVVHNGTCTVTIGFTPSQLGTRGIGVTLTLLDNGTTCPQNLSVSGTGTIDMSVMPTIDAFGSVKVGSKATKTITVHNYQTNQVLLNLPPAFTGSNPGDFNVTGGTCTTLATPSTLLAKSLCTLIVTYTPTAVGTEGATMTVTDSPDAASPTGYQVSFTTGETIPESLSAKGLGFGGVPRTGSKTMNLTVFNNATTGSITLPGPTTSGSSDFQVTGGSCTTLAGGSLAALSNCTYAVTFAPTSEGTLETGSLSLPVTEDPNSPLSVTLKGTGTVPDSASPKTLSFGNVYQTASKTLYVTLTNRAHTAGGLLTLTGASTGTSDFQVTSGGTCPLPNGTVSAASCTYAVTFTPSTEALETDALSIGVLGESSPLSVTLSGTGLIPLSVTPATLAFGTLAVGKTSAAKTVTVTNKGGEALTISDSAAPTGFAVSGGTCPTLGEPLAGNGASCTYTITFTPPSTGAFSGQLQITDTGTPVTDGASPHSVTLSGTGD